MSAPPPVSLEPEVVSLPLSPSTSPSTYTSISSPPAPEGSQFSKGRAFWLSFVALVVSILLSALDLTAVSTALPTITHDLNGGDKYVWVGSAYALSSTAVLPLSGGLADIFGRKPILLIAIVFFAIGSALAGAAKDMNMLIAARTVQGIGGGSIINLTSIIVADLVPLAQRGLYQGMIGLTWAFSSAIGPIVGGGLAEKASWRWLFYLNLPLTFLAFILVLFFLSVRTPTGSMKEKILLVDWTGNAIVVAGTTLAVTGLTFGGGRFSWTSVQVLAPLIIGFGLIGVFLYYEARVPKRPTVPFDIMSNRTSFGGFMATLIHGIASISIIYYFPIYFQACLGTSPVGSGVDILPASLVMALCSLCGALMIRVIRKYVLSNVLGWVLTVIGFGLLSLLKADSSTSKWIGYQFVVAAGLGVIYTSTVFVILAPLPVSRAAAALALFAFIRSFAQTWGVTISSTILQNQLKKKLPAAFVSQFSSDVEIAYAAIPLINGLDEPLRTEVRAAFADSIAVIWKTMIGIAGLGCLTLFLLREVPMGQTTDEKYGLTDEKHAGTPHVSTEAV